MPDMILMEAEEKMLKSIEAFEHELAQVRTGRANPAILDSVFVNYYGCPTQLKQMASISTPEANQLYIKPFDMFIELNASWTHGGHWFDEHNPLDVSTLLSWADHHSRYYDSAIHVWTVRDPMKRQCAIDNGLNYLVFWDNDLTDARRWLSQYMKL